MISRKVIGLIGAMAVLCSVGSIELRANTFASDVRVSFSGNFQTGAAVISFVLSDKADAVTVRIMRGNTVVHTINAEALSAGPNAVSWNGTGNTGDGIYTYEIETFNKGYPSWTQIFDSGDINIFTRGCDIIRNPLLPRFGHWLAGDAGGGDYQKGLSEWHADGQPADPVQPLLLPQIGQPWHLTTDDEGYIYFSDILNRKIYRLNPDFTNLRVIINEVRLPRGIYVRGTGAEKTIYFAADTSVFRAKIGTADTFATQPEKILEARTYVRDVVVDDNGFLYVTLRTIDPADSLDGGEEGTVTAYDISGALPAEGPFFLFSIPMGRPIGLALNRGKNLASNVDDSLYVSLRAFGDTNAGIFKIDLMQGTARRLVDYDVNANRRADLCIDPAGNLVWFENGEEHIYMYSPPGPNRFITPNPPGQEIVVGTTAVQARKGDSAPGSFILYPAHPNPLWASAFDPSIKLRFDLMRLGHARLRIFDLSGREVATIVDQPLAAGHYEYTWDARDLPSGIYLYRLEALGFSATHRATIVK